MSARAAKSDLDAGLRLLAGGNVRLQQRQPGHESGSLALCHFRDCRSISIGTHTAPAL
jgi:hypothetical protein